MTILILYTILTIIIFASYRILRRPRFNIMILIISAIFLVLEVYGLTHSNILNIELKMYYIFSWLFFLILTFNFLRRQFVNQKGFEPIITRGHPYDPIENRKALMADTIFTMMVLVIPFFLTFITGELIILIADAN